MSTELLFQNTSVTLPRSIENFDEIKAELSTKLDYYLKRTEPTCGSSGRLSTRSGRKPNVRQWLCMRSWSCNAVS